jgi:hypothetical protein
MPANRCRRFTPEPVPVHHQFANQNVNTSRKNIE